MVCQRKDIDFFSTKLSRLTKEALNNIIGNTLINLNDKRKIQEYEIDKRPKIIEEIDLGLKLNEKIKGFQVFIKLQFLLDTSGYTLTNREEELLIIESKAEKFVRNVISKLPSILLKDFQSNLENNIYSKNIINKDKYASLELELEDYSLVTADIHEDTKQINILVKAM
ncbi:MAG: hypothetical protein J0H68_09235 [Sphingobacteriia bacterium]|nr:hypothetical protein [Sphingobacteriia bacterium]